TTVAGPAGPDARAQDGPEGGALAVSWTPVACGDGWTAQLHATTGGADVSRVVAVAARTGAVRLQRDGDGWSGTLTGLPTDRTVTVTVLAPGLRPASTRLSSNC
ncbi:MAG TPA: hypothetical protein VI357_10650, partial [Mycobacteriales bacterium]